MTTFDTESELSKVANVCPGIKLVLRVRCDDPEVSCCRRQQLKLGLCNALVLNVCTKG